MNKKSLGGLLLGGLLCSTWFSAVSTWGQEPRVRVIEKGGTVFLDDPVLLQEKPSVQSVPTVSPAATPMPTVRTSATARPLPTPTPRLDADAEERLLRAERRFRSSFGSAITGAVVRRREVGLTLGTSEGPGARGEIFVGQTFGVPIEYAPAQIRQTVQSGGSTTVVVPASPTRFAPVRSGVSWGAAGFRSSELQGFVDYGSPIRTIAPVFDAHGHPVGYQILETPNRLLQPVWQTIEIR